MIDCLFLETILFLILTVWKSRQVANIRIATKKSLKKRAARYGQRAERVEIATIESRKSMRPTAILIRGIAGIIGSSYGVERRDKGEQERGRIRMPRKYREHNNQK